MRSHRFWNLPFLILRLDTAVCIIPFGIQTLWILPFGIVWFLFHSTGFGSYCCGSNRFEILPFWIRPVANPTACTPAALDLIVSDPTAWDPIVLGPVVFCPPGSAPDRCGSNRVIHTVSTPAALDPTVPVSDLLGSDRVKPIFCCRAVWDRRVYGPTVSNPIVFNANGLELTVLDPAGFGSCRWGSHRF